MSPQVVELLIFAAIAFFIINKLISILGATDDDTVRKSKFGENNAKDNVSIKDVTQSGSDWTQYIKIMSSSKKKVEINTSLLAYPDNSELVERIEELSEKIDKFTPEVFLKNAAKARIMIIEAIFQKDNDALAELVDKRYIQEMLSKGEYYQNIDIKTLPDIKISDVTFFGNSIMIKIIVDSKIIEPEEWTFTRNMNQTGPNWFLSNIEKVA